MSAIGDSGNERALVDYYPVPAAELPTDAPVRRELHRTMLRIRMFEETTADRVARGEIKTPVHLTIGQEATAAGVCSVLRPDDAIFGGHRSHGHYLAKGGSLPAMAAEILGRSTGCSGGRGGSMHLYASEVGIYGTVPIVSATIPLAVGAAFAIQRRGEGGVAVSFFGDGAVEEGQFHESMNFAALYRLPVIFVCENNWHSSHLRLEERRVADNILDFGSAHGMAAERVDGNDAEAVREVAARAVDRARRGGGPTLIEARTYRWRGHVGPNWDLEYGIRPEPELRAWMDHDPILIAERRMEADGDGASATAAREAVAAEVAAAWALADAAPFPEVVTLEAHVFTEVAR